MRRIDVRDLDPPEPLIRIAKALEELEEDDILEVLGSRPFTHLLPRLKELGYSYKLEKTSEGYLLTIKKLAREEQKITEEEDLEIDETTNVGKLIDRYPEALDILIRYGFTPLKNPILRRTLPYIVSLKQAKKIRRMPDEKFEKMLEELRKLISQA